MNDQQLSLPFGDGLENYVTGLGTSRDKSSHSTYVAPIQDDQQLSAMYRSSAIARKIIDMPARDSMREWRAWQADPEDITKIEAVETALVARKKLIRASNRARLFGGAAVFIGTGDKDLMRPLEPSKIGKDGIKYLTTLTKFDLTPGELQRNASEEGYGKPTYYSLNNGEKIHPSRLVKFDGNPIDEDPFIISASGWGESSLIPCIESVRNLDSTMANIASLVFEAKVDVLGIPNLMENLRKGGNIYEQLLLRRTQLAAMGKGINGMLVTDAEETYNQKSASFSTLPDIAVTYMQKSSADASIPMTLLFGTSPGGLNSTGESDTRGYYDSVKSVQTLDLQPELTILDECIIRSALGARPEEIFYNWVPLWQPTTKERAETGKTIVETFKSVYDMNVLPEEALAKSIVNGLTESGLAPGLEGDVKEWYEENGSEETEEDNVAAIEGGPEGGSDDDGEDTRVNDVHTLSDAVPATLYVSRKVLNGSDILRWAKAQGFSTTLPAEELHVTLAYSKAPVDWMSIGETWQKQIEVTAGGPRTMERFGDASVLSFRCSDLEWRHQEIHEASGAVWEHDKYQPHMTISWSPDAPMPDDVVAYQGPIILGPEIFAKIDDDWQSKLKEE